MPHVPSSGPGSYPPTTLGADPYPKVPLSGTPGYATEPHELPLSSSIPPAVHMPLVGSEHQPPMRSHYTYVQSTTAPPPLPVNTSAISGPEHALSIPRYVDSNPRPAKSPRHTSQQSVQSTGSLANHEASPEYRYGSYAPVPSSSSVTQPYSTEPAATSQAPPRDYYPPASTWTSTAGETNSSVAYASSDGRSYSYSQEQYKTPPTGTPPGKTDAGQAPAMYSGGSRGSSYDTLNNYSWSGN